MGYPINVYPDDDGAFKSKVEELFDGEGINHIVTLTHANVVEIFTRTQNRSHDRVRFTNGKWEDMLKFVVTNYNNTIHSTTNHTPKEAHQDKNSPDVAANLTTKNTNKRKHKNINVGDDVKAFTKCEGNYTSRKEATSRWCDRTYKVVKIDRERQHYMHIMY